jgi:O-antigen ligase
MLFWLKTKIKRTALYVAMLAIMITAVFVAALKFPFLKSRFQTTVQFDYTELNGNLWTSTTYRLAIWSCSLEIIKRDLTGHGTSDGQKALEDMYKERGFIRGTLDRYNSHNEFLTTTLDLGVAGLLVILLTVVLGSVEAFKSKQVLVISFMIMIVFYFMVESVLVRQKGIVFFSFFYSFLFWQSPDQKE